MGVHGGTTNFRVCTPFCVVLPFYKQIFENFIGPPVLYPPHPCVHPCYWTNKLHSEMHRTTSVWKLFSELKEFRVSKWPLIKHRPLKFEFRVPIWFTSSRFESRVRDSIPEFEIWFRSSRFNLRVGVWLKFEFEKISGIGTRSWEVQVFRVSPTLRDFRTPSSKCRCLT